MASAKPVADHDGAKDELELFSLPTQLCLHCSVPDSRTPASHRLLQCPVQGYAWDKRGREEPEEEQGENEREGERKVENGNTE